MPNIKDDSSQDLQLENIFHKIQLWGGNAGRNVYVRDGGFDRNFNIEAYRSVFRGIKKIQSLDDFNRGYAGEPSQIYQIRHFGVSFATKHFKFISKALSNFTWPIYDRVIAKGLYGRSEAAEGQYAAYVNDIYAFAERRNYRVDIVERALFNYFSDSAGGAVETNNLNFPDIKYDYDQLPPLAARRFTTDAMKTNMTNHGYGDVAKELPQNATGSDMSNLEESIRQAIIELGGNTDFSPNPAAGAVDSDNSPEPISQKPPSEGLPPEVMVMRTNPHNVLIKLDRGPANYIGLREEEENANIGYVVRNTGVICVYHRLQQLLNEAGAEYDLSAGGRPCGGSKPHAGNIKFGSADAALAWLSRFFTVKEYEK